MSVLSIGELLDIGGSASTAGLVPYSALEYNGSGCISGISGSAIAGGGSVDSAAVSAIASSYAESAVSSVVDTVSSNSASWGGSTGDFVEKSAINVTIGDSNSADGIALAQGLSSFASAESFAQGKFDTAKFESIAQGSSNSAYGGSLAQGYNNKAYINSLSQGDGNYTRNDSFAQGSFNTAFSYSFAQGASSYANFSSFVQGSYVSAKDYAAVFGRCNLRGDGDTSSGNSAAFAIGDGTGTASRHDLMLVTKNGEITMYSGTADTTGIGLVSSIRNLSSTVSSNSASWGGGGASTAGLVPYSALEYNSNNEISGISGSAIAGQNFNPGQLQLIVDSANMSASSIANGVQIGVKDGVYQPVGNYQTAGAYATGLSVVAVANSSQATASDVVYIVTGSL
jgi:hypothetical protein